MIILDETQVQEISGGIPLGVVVAALVIGAVTGGPVGLGIATGGLIINEGTTKLEVLINTGEIT